MDQVTVRKKTNPLHNATPVMVMVQLKLQSVPAAEGGEVDDEEDDEYEEDRDEEEDKRPYS